MIAFVFGDTQLGPEHRAAVRAHLRRLDMLSRIVHPGGSGAARLAASEAMGEYVNRTAGVVHQDPMESPRKYVHRLIRNELVGYWLMFHMQADFKRGKAAELLSALKRRKIPGRVVLLSVAGSTVGTHDFDPASD